MAYRFKGNTLGREIIFKTKCQESCEKASGAGWLVRESVH